MMDKESVLRIIEKRLDEKYWSVQRLAKEINIPKQTVYHWLNRETVMPIDKMFKVMKALNVKVQFKKGRNIIRL